MNLKDMSVEELIEIRDSETFVQNFTLASEYTAELLRRFGELEERRDFWIEKATLLNTKNGGLEKQIAALQKQVEELRCCGNCVYYDTRAERMK